MKKARRAARHPSAPRPPAIDVESSRLTTVVVMLAALLALIILFSPFVFSDKMLYGSDTLQAGYYFRSFFIEHWQTHGFSIPQWNPYIFGGMPYVEAFHGDILYPPSLVGKAIAYAFDNLYRMLGWGLFWHIFFAGLFMYLCARQFRLRRVPALVAGLSYMFAGYLVSLVAPGHDGKIFVTSLFPLAMLFLDRGFERRPLVNFSLMGLVIGFIVLSPHPQMSYFTLWALAAYTAYRLVRMLRERQPAVRVAGRAVLALYAVVIGLALSAVQFYPGYVYTTEFSPRADAKRGWEWATSWSMHEEEAMSLLIPEFSGTQTRDGSSYYWGKNAFKDNSESTGVVPLFLALLGILFSRRRERWFFGGLALFALTYALAATTPLFHLYYLIPKVASMRAASMIMFLFAFSVAMLAGMGMQRVIESVRERDALPAWFPRVLWGMPLLLLVLAVLFSAAGRSMIDLWTSLFYSEAATIVVQGKITKLDLAYMNLPAVTRGAWLAFLFTAAAAATVWWYLRRRSAEALLLAVGLVIMVDGVRFNSRFIDTVDFERQFGDNPVTQYLAAKARPGAWRVLDMRFRNAPQSLELPLHDVAVPVGYHGNQLRWYDDLLGGLALSNLFKAPFLNLVGVRYLILPSGQKLPDGFLGPAPVTAERNLGQAIVYRNDNALPRVYLADSVVVVPDRKEIYPRVVSGAEDLRRVVFLETAPDLSVHPSADSLPADSAWLISYDTDSVVVGVSCRENRILVLTDSWYDAWRVTVDGRPAACLRAYGALRAVPVPAGARTVVFRFDSPRYRTGRTVTALTTFYLLAIFAVQVVRRRRETEEENT